MEMVHVGHYLFEVTETTEGNFTFSSTEADFYVQLSERGDQWFVHGPGKVLKVVRTWAEALAEVDTYGSRSCRVKSLEEARSYLRKMARQEFVGHLSTPAHYLPGLRA